MTDQEAIEALRQDADCNVAMRIPEAECEYAHAIRAIETLAKVREWHAAADRRGHRGSARLVLCQLQKLLEAKP